ncbi:MAG TPA: nitroreductase family protein, partial [Allosphingosinicella sp.]|nr:nitroreductase family protein [Allosphingosinicella sp.]
MTTATEAVLARYSVRAFLDRPVARATVEEILELASRSPSGGNLQPWHVDVLAGEALADLKAHVRLSLASNPA